MRARAEDQVEAGGEEEIYISLLHCGCMLTPKQQIMQDTWLTA